MIGKKSIFSLLAILLSVAMAPAIVIPAMAETETPVTEPTGDPALSTFQQINQEGFGNPENVYAWSMVNFKGDVYVGTWNLGPSSTLIDALTILPLPRSNPEPNISAGAEVWKYVGEPSTNSWDMVVDDGLEDNQNMGLRTMLVWDNKADEKGEAIYGTTLNPYQGLEVWRSYDGKNWGVVVGRELGEDGIDDTYGNGFSSGDSNESGRGMVAFPDEDGEERLYVGTIGTNGGEIWRTKKYAYWVGREEGMRIPTWEKVTDAYTLEGDRNALAVSGMCLYDDDGNGSYSLFVATWKGDGFSIYRTDDGSNFDKVATGGIEHPTNMGVQKLIVFQNRLWVLTVNFIRGFDVYASRQEAGRIGGNEDWELIVTRGFTDPLNMYAWNAAVYDCDGEGGEPERLYIGTFNLPRGFYLYSVTPEGEWAVEVGEGSEVPNGINSNLNYGIRTFEVWEGKLAIGSVGLYKPADVYLAW